MASFQLRSEPTHPPPSCPLPPLPKKCQSAGPILKRSTTIGTPIPVSSTPKQLPKATPARTSCVPSVPLTNDSSSPSSTATIAVSIASNSHASVHDSRKRKLYETISYKNFPKPPSGTPNRNSIEEYANSNSPSIISPLDQSSHGPIRSFSDATTATAFTSPLTSISPHSIGHISTDKTRELTRDSLEASSENKSELIVEGLSATKLSRSHKKAQNVIVSVRVRPNNDGFTNNTENDWTVDGLNSRVAYRGQEFIFDNVFTAQDDNAAVYSKSAQRIARKVMEGYHGTMFAYGTTGTGKTFSMQGTNDQIGIIPRAISELFNYVREHPQREFLLRVSYLEIYNEKINDLLSNSGQQEDIKLREDGRRGIYATPVIEELVQSTTQLLRVIARGDHARRTSSTEFNVRSSRSHAVVQILVESRERSTVSPNDKRAPLSGVRISTLSLIDLAGSEKAADSKERRTEGSHINKSLLTLGTVISKLSGKANANDKHLPFRDSKLTRLLQYALSGDALVSILCTIQVSGGPVGSSSYETLNTLNFAARARNNIVSHAKKAPEAWGDSETNLLISKFRKEIMELRKQVEEQKSERTRAWEKEEQDARDVAARMKHEAYMLEMQLAQLALTERMHHVKQIVQSSQGRPYSTMSPQSSFLNLDSSNTKRLRASNPNPLLSQTKTYDEQTVSAQCGDFSDEDEEPEPKQPSPISIESNTALEKQLKALSASLSEKDEYISTLEKLLAREQQSRQITKRNNGSTHSAEVDTKAELLLKEKDAQIAAMKEVLIDKERSLRVLKNAMARTKGITDKASPSPVTAGTRSVSAPQAKEKLNSTGIRGVNGTLDPKIAANGAETSTRKVSPNHIARLTTTAANLSRLRVGTTNKSTDKPQPLATTAELPRPGTQASSTPATEKIPSQQQSESPNSTSNLSEDGLPHETPPFSPLERLTQRVAHAGGGRKAPVVQKNKVPAIPPQVVAGTNGNRSRTVYIKA